MKEIESLKVWHCASHELFLYMDTGNAFSKQSRFHGVYNIQKVPSRFSLLPKPRTRAQYLHSCTWLLWQYLHPGSLTKHYSRGLFAVLRWRLINSALAWRSWYDLVIEQYKNITMIKKVFLLLSKDLSIVIARMLGETTHCLVSLCFLSRYIVFRNIIHVSVICNVELKTCKPSIFCRYTKIRNK